MPAGPLAKRLQNVRNLNLGIAHGDGFLAHTVNAVLYAAERNTDREKGQASRVDPFDGTQSSGSTVSGTGVLFFTSERLGRRGHLRHVRDQPARKHLRLLRRHHDLQRLLENNGRIKHEPIDQLKLHLRRRHLLTAGNPGLHRFGPGIFQ